MLTIAKLRHQSVAIYVDTARRAAQADDLPNTDVDLAAVVGTSMPIWIAAGVGRDSALELTGIEAGGGRADLGAIARWLDDGLAPSGASGRAMGCGNAVHGFDLTFAAPKSVSLMRSRGELTTAASIADSHTHAIGEAMEYLAVHAGYTRVFNRQTRRQDLVVLPGIVAAAFQHETSRAGDPHLNTHVLVPNRQVRADGRLVSLDSVSLYHEARAAGIIYQVTLRRELTRSIGVEWSHVDPRTGMAEVAGAHREDLAVWSTRGKQLREWAAERWVAGSVPTAKQLATAQKATRTGESEGLTFAQLRALWATDARLFRVDSAAHLGARTARLRLRIDYAAVATQAIADVAAASFTRADMIEAIGARMPIDAADGPPPRQVLESLVDALTRPIGSERAAHQREGSTRYRLVHSSPLRLALLS